MDLSVLVPWRAGDPDREKAWTYLQAYWLAISSDLIMDIEVVEGHDSGVGPFNCAQAINDAFRKSTGRYVAIFGADCLPDLRSLEITWHRLTAGQAPWVPMYNRVDYWDKAGTSAIIDEAYFPDEVSICKPMSVPFQTAYLAMPREHYIEAGGHDERFVGWGAEDSAFRRSLYLLYGDQESVDLPMRCLHHAGGHRSMSDNNLKLIREYEQIDDKDRLKQYLKERGTWV